MPPNSLSDGTTLFRIKRFGDTGLIGQIIWYSGSRIPDNYLLCDGSQLNRNSYNELFKIIGTTYGSGDNSTTFNIPLLIDHKFIEGSINPGIIKSPGLPNIKGYIHSPLYEICLDDNLETTGPFGSEKAQNPVVVGEHANLSRKNIDVSTFTFDASKVNSIYGNSNDVQPYSITLLPLIKYI